MNSMDVEVVRTAMDWMNRGHRVVLGTVVRTWGSSPRPPGSLMVIRDDGQVAGSVSGGCIEDDLIDRVKRGELALRLPQTTSYGASAEEAQRFGLPCGGTVQIVLEPLSAGSRLRELLAAVEEHRVVRRPLELAVRPTWPTTTVIRTRPARSGRCRPQRGLAGRAGPVARPLARHKQSTGLFVSGLGLPHCLWPARRLVSQRVV